MKVEFIRSRSIGVAGPDGPSTRVFSVGEEVILPELHGRMFIMNGDARLLEEGAPEGPPGGLLPTVEDVEPVEDVEQPSKPGRRKATADQA
ncbi:MAG: hypothetical protein Q8M17_10565 [Actinomycetota bacterium]|nr:hypothetical protein [Actinomycetota bacterium]